MLPAGKGLATVLCHMWTGHAPEHMHMTYAILIYTAYVSFLRLAAVPG